MIQRPMTVHQHYANLLDYTGWLPSLYYSPFQLSEHATQCNAMQYNTMQCNAMQCNAMQCNAMQCNAMQYNTIQTNGAVSCNNSLPVLGSPNQCAALKCASSSLSFLPLSGSSKKEACNALNIRQARLPGQKGEVATSCTWAPCLVDTVSSGRTGPW